MDLADAAQRARSHRVGSSPNGRRIARSPSPAVSRFAMARSPCRNPAGARTTSTAVAAPFVHLAAHPLHTGYRRPTFFRDGADAFFEIESWRDYVTSSRLIWRHSRRGCRSGGPNAAALTARMATRPRDALSSTIPLIILIDAPTADVSSTAIRDHLAAGESIAGLVPQRVQQHIEQHGLYTSMIPGRRALDAPQTAPAGRLHDQE